MNYDNLLFFMLFVSFHSQITFGLQRYEKYLVYANNYDFYTSKTHHNRGCNRFYYNNILALQPSK